MPATRCRASGQLGALLSSPVLGVRLLTALQVLQVLDVSSTAGSSVEEAGKVCVVCLSGPRTHAVKPCRHLCLCPDCAATALKDLDTFSQCPICRADMDGVMRIYEP